jgi:hypothetical protein
MFRCWALGWLRDDLALYTKLIERGDPDARKLVRTRLGHWLGNPNLAGLRDPAALAPLPETERGVCLALWSDVDALLRRAGQNP